MSFHISNFGSFSKNITADKNGYVPTADTDPWELDYDHGVESTHDDEGNLTEYGDWWESDRFPEIRKAAIKATAQSESAIAEWQAIPENALCEAEEAEWQNSEF